MARRRLARALAALVPHRAAPSGLSPLRAQPSSLVPFGHRFVVPTAQQRSGMVPGTESDTVLAPGTKLYQWQVPGAPQGNWYSRHRYHPFHLGISPFGQQTVHHVPPPDAAPIPLAGNAGVLMPGSVETRVVRKELREYVARAAVAAHQSTAAEIPDKWSHPGVVVNASGSGEQLVVHNRGRIGHTQK